MLRAIAAAFLILFLEPAVAAPDQVFLLDFMTQEATTSRHGALSLIDGITKSTWTVQTGSSKKTFDVSISELAFRKVWDGTSDMAEINAFRVKDPDVRLDFTRNYVVGVVYSVYGQQGRATFLIPHDSKSAAAVKWARAIESLSGQQGA
jgi:hypothetical protein